MKTVRRTGWAAVAVMACLMMGASVFNLWSAPFEELNLNKWLIKGVEVTATAAELNKLAAATPGAVEVTTLTAAAITLGGNPLTVTNVTGTGTLNIGTGTNKFTVSADGNTAVAGTLNVTGLSTLGTVSPTVINAGTSTNKFTVSAAGNAAVAGTLNVTGVSTLGTVSPTVINAGTGTNTFTVSAAGNAAVAGTLGVTGATTLSSNLTWNGAIIIFDYDKMPTATNGLVKGTLWNSSGAIKIKAD